LFFSSILKTIIIIDVKDGIKRMKRLSKDKAGGGGLNGQDEPDAYFIQGEDLPWRRHEGKKENELGRC
jgi:hypothetical protein